MAETINRWRRGGNWSTRRKPLHQDVSWFKVEYVAVPQKQHVRVLIAFGAWCASLYLFWRIGDPFPILSPKHGMLLLLWWWWWWWWCASLYLFWRIGDPFPILSTKHGMLLLLLLLLLVVVVVVVVVCQSLSLLADRRSLPYTEY